MRKLWAGLSALVIATAMMFVGNQSASAVYNCGVWWGGDPAYWASATCDYGLGEFQVRGYCWDGWHDQLYAGPWRTAGGISTMICGGGRVLDGAWYATR